MKSEIKGFKVKTKIRQPSDTGFGAILLAWVETSIGGIWPEL